MGACCVEVGFRNSSSLPRKHENIGLLVTGFSVSLLLYPILSALAVLGAHANKHGFELAHTITLFLGS